MFKHFTILISISLTLFSQNFYAQVEENIQGSPAWLIDMYFIQTQFFDKANYFTGEMIEEVEHPTIGEELNGTADVSFHKIHSENGKEVYSIEVVVNETTVDFYCYLLKTSDGWKIEAVRRFLLPGFIYSAKDSLSQITNLSPSDSDLLELVNLLTSSDEVLKTYLRNNVNDFYKLVLYIKDEDAKNIQNMLTSLNIDAVYQDENFPGCIFLQIGAFDTTEMGYFYKEANSILPEISPNGFIIIEEVLPKWFLYRII